MPRGLDVIVASSGTFYAINNGTFTEDTEANIRACLRNIMFWLKTMSLEADPTKTDPDASNNKSIHWIQVRDELLPDANNFIDDLFRVRYYTPFRKTLASGTQYSKHIVQIASLYCAWRIEMRDFIGSGSIDTSDYSTKLRTILNERCNEILGNYVRLPGQRLKANNRFINPHIEEIVPGVKQGLDQAQNQAASVQTSYRTQE